MEQFKLIINDQTINFKYKIDKSIKFCLKEHLSYFLKPHVHGEVHHFIPFPHVMAVIITEESIEMIMKLVQALMTSYG